jgi:cation diffusion facilitator family transporter
MALLQIVLAGHDTRNLFLFICALAFVMLLEGTYGMLVDSLGASPNKRERRERNCRSLIRPPTPRRRDLCSCSPTAQRRLPRRCVRQGYGPHRPPASAEAACPNAPCSRTLTSTLTLTHPSPHLPALLAALITDAFHMAFHCIGLAISLFGMMHARRTPPSFAFSYGTDRYEVLAAFSNALMMVFVCLFVIAGALHRLVEGAKEEAIGSHSNALFFFGLLGLGVNVAGVLTLGAGSGSWQQVVRFQGSSAAAGGGASSSSSPASGSGGAGGPSSSGGAYNSRAVFLHVYADAVSSLAVVLSALAQKNFGLTRSADTLCAVFVAVFTLNKAVPLFSATAYTLLQTTPPHLRTALERSRREALTVEGVLEVYDERWWTQSPGFTVGSLVVRVRADADETAVLKRVQRAYGKIVTDLTVQVEKDPPLSWLQGGEGGAGGAGAFEGVAVDGGGGGGGECSGHGHAHDHGGHSHDHGGHSHDHGGHSHW